MDRILKLSCVLSALTQIGGCALFYKYGEISEKPPLEASNGQLEPKLSSLQPALNVPLSLLQDAANRAASEALPISEGGRTRLAEIKIPKPFIGGCWICESIDAIWNFTVSQPEGFPITVAGEADQLVVGVSGRLEGGAGFNGDIANWLSLRRKEFGASLTVRFKTGLDADVNYCPRLRNPSFDYRWITEPYAEFAGRSCFFGSYCIGPLRLHFPGPVNAALDKNKAKISIALQQNMPCDGIREGLAMVWRPYSFPVTVPYESLHLNIRPESIYLPGIRVSNTDLVLVGRLDAKVSLDPAPLSEEQLPLPPNNPQQIEPGRFSLAIPISTQYYTFRALAKQQITDNKYIVDTSLGRVRIVPTSVDLYPTNGGQQLALGVAVAIEFERSFLFNTSAKVWLTARPEALNGGRRVRLSDVKVTRKFSNPLWDIVSVVIDEKITSALRDGFELDLNEPLSKAEADITTMINNAGAGGNVKLTARDVKISVGRMLANSKAFQLEALFDAHVDADLGSLPTR